MAQTAEEWFAKQKDLIECKRISARLTARDCRKYLKTWEPTIRLTPNHKRVTDARFSRCVDCPRFKAVRASQTKRTKLEETQGKQSGNSISFQPRH